MWVLIAIQIVLSLALIITLLITASWLRSSVEDSRHIKRLVERMGLTIQQIRADIPSALKGRSLGSMPRQGGGETPPISLDTMPIRAAKQA